MLRMKQTGKDRQRKLQNKTKSISRASTVIKHVVQVPAALLLAQLPADAQVAGPGMECPLLAPGSPLKSEAEDGRSLFLTLSLCVALRLSNK